MSSPEGVRPHCHRAGSQNQAENSFVRTGIRRHTVTCEMEVQMSGIRSLAMGVALGAMMFGNCGWAADPMKLKLIFSTPYSTNYTPYIVAKDLGFFQKEG